MSEAIQYDPAALVDHCGGLYGLLTQGGVDSLDRITAELFGLADSRGVTLADLPFLDGLPTERGREELAAMIAAHALRNRTPVPSLVHLIQFARYALTGGALVSGYSMPPKEAAQS